MDSSNPVPGLKHLGVNATVGERQAWFQVAIIFLYIKYFTAYLASKRSASLERSGNRFLEDVKGEEAW